MVGREVQTCFFDQTHRCGYVIDVELLALYEFVGEECVPEPGDSAEVVCDRSVGRVSISVDQLLCFSCNRLGRFVFRALCARS